MAGKPHRIRRAEFKQITKMLFECKPDIDIIRELHLKERTYYKYKSMIFAEHAELFRQEQMSNIGYYSSKLHYKLSGYQAALEARLASCKEAKDTAVLIELAADLAKTIFELEMHRLEVLDDIKSLDNKIRPFVSGENNNDITIKKTVRFIPETKDAAS